MFSFIPLELLIPAMLRSSNTSLSHSWESNTWNWVVTGTTVLAGLVAGGVWWYQHRQHARTPTAAAPPLLTPPNGESSAAPSYETPSHATPSYETLTRDELYDIARERDIHGRSSMRKAELLEAVRATDPHPRLHSDA